jgi:predicted permease
VGPKYFEVLDIPLLQGRDFTERDNEDAPRVVIINEAMAQRFWPDQEALGKRISITGAKGPFMEIIGIAKNTVVRSIGEAPLPYFCLPRLQNYYPQSKLIAQTSLDPSSILATVRREVRGIDSNVPVFDTKVFSQHVGESLWAVRVGAGLLSIYGFLALVLAVLGVYGVMSYWVSQRTREIGIQRALGAQSSTVIKSVLSRSFLVVAIGMIIGLVGAFLTMRVASNLLYEISPMDLVTYIGSILITLAVALVASLFAARKAIKIDPLIALKYE